MKKNKFIVFFLCVIIALSTMALCGCDGDKTDYVTLINEITLNKMSANVKIELYNKNIVGEWLVAEGSGVIYRSEKSSDDSFEYYVLSNNHVVSVEVDDKKVFYLYDYLGVRYQCELVAKNSSCDLSVLKFETSSQLSTIEFAESLPKINSTVFAVSTPKSQTNAITVGKFIGVISAPKTENIYSNIQFQVIKHSAQIKEGSSGSMLLDANLKLIGINYAGVVDTDTKEYLNTLAVPLAKVNEFLQAVG